MRAYYTDVAMVRCPPFCAEMISDTADPAVPRLTPEYSGVYGAPVDQHQ
jgi:hypothetical protein